MEDGVVRMPRLKASPELPVAYYHCLSRVVDRQFVLGDREREKFVELLRMYEAFCEVRVVTYCVMNNHFHVLLEIAQRPAGRVLSDTQLLGRLKAIYSPIQIAGVSGQLEHFRKTGAHAAAEAYKQSFLERMGDLSFFMKLVKQRFSQWFNRVHQRRGTLWEERFKSVLVEGASEALWAMAAYIDLNPVRAGMVPDSKDYRWSGYAEALAGGKAARDGLRVVVQAQHGQPVPQGNEVLRLYRTLLFVAGEEQGLANDQSEGRVQGRDEAREQCAVIAPRMGFSRDQIQSVLDAKGRLSWGQMLHCKVRYFSDGVALGTQGFIEGIFHAQRHRFGPKRTSGARPMRQLDAGPLRTLRDLRLLPVSLTGASG